MSSPSDCPKEQILLDYVAGRLDPSQVRRVDDHLASCDSCSHAAAWFQSVPRALDGSSDSGATPVASSSTNPSHNLAPDAGFDEPLDDDLSDLFEASPNPDAKGRIDKYDILEPVGHGGMGVVYKAFDTKLQRTVAIKILKRHLAVGSTAKRRFEREARAAAAISHANVVTIHAVEECQGVPYIVMEFVDGYSLRQRTRKKPLAEPIEIIRLSAQIAAGLAAAHAKGVIHRDVKPANIMLENKVERAKITDFGLVRVTLENVELTSHGLAVGTPAYMAPEQVLGETIDGRADLFSLGCVMYAMVAGYSPFHGKVALEVSRKIVEESPTPLGKVNPDIPPFFNEIVARLLEKKPGDRFQTAAEVEELLGQFLADLNQNSDSGRKAIHKIGGGRTVHEAKKSRRRLAGWFALVAAALIVALGLMSSWPWPPVAPANLTVGKSGGADFSTISAALDAAGPGTVITLLDDASYEEPIRIADGQRLSGVKLVSHQRATISVPWKYPQIISISDTPNVSLQGLRILVRNEEQFAILVQGHSQGLLIDNVRIEADVSTKWSSIQFSRDVAGTAENPIVIRDSVFVDSHPAAVNVDTSMEFLRLEDNHFRGGTVHFQLNVTAREIRVVGNIFDAGDDSFGDVHAILFALDIPSTSGNILIANNTFFGNLHWLDLRPGSEQCIGIGVHNNLVLGAVDISDRTTPFSNSELRRLSKGWVFSHNVWETGPKTMAYQIDEVAERNDGEIEVINRVDRDYNDFLRLSPGSPLMKSGMGGDLPEFVGARASHADDETPMT